MKPEPDGWSVVIAGNWNPMIFTPKWIAEFLMNGSSDEKNIRIQLSRENPFLPRLKFDEILFQVTPDRVILSPEIINDKNLMAIQKASITLLKELKHTPLNAVGINFVFVEDNPSSELSKYFNLLDSKLIANSDMKISMTEIKRKLLMSDDNILNLSLFYDIENSKCILDLNFHRDVDSATEAQTHIEKGVVNFQNKAIEILKSVYKLSLMEEE